MLSFFDFSSKKKEKIQIKTNTPLHALFKDNNESSDILYKKAKFFLENKTDPNIQNKKGETCLHLACKNKLVTVEIVALLLQYGANPNLVTIENESCLHYTINKRNPSAPALIEFLLQNKADPNIKNDQEITALNAVCRDYDNNNFTIIHSLLKYKADPNICDKWGVSPLYWVSNFMHKNDSLNSFKLLIQNFANIKTRNNRGETCLFPACVSADSVDKISYLLTLGLDPHAKNRFDETCMASACSNSHPHAGVNIIKLLFSKGLAAKHVNKFGDSYLKSACLNHKEADNILKLLVLHTPDVLLTEHDPKGGTCLHLVCKSYEPKIEAVNFLLEQGIDPNITDKEGYSCVERAIKAKNYKVVLFFALKGFDFQRINPPIGRDGQLINYMQMLTAEERQELILAIEKNILARFSLKKHVDFLPEETKSQGVNWLLIAKRMKDMFFYPPKPIQQIIFGEIVKDKILISMLSFLSIEKLNDIIEYEFGLFSSKKNRFLN